MDFQNAIYNPKHILHILCCYGIGHAGALELWDSFPTQTNRRERNSAVLPRLKEQIKNLPEEEPKAAVPTAVRIKDPEMCGDKKPREEMFSPKTNHRHIAALTCGVDISI